MCDITKCGAVSVTAVPPHSVTQTLGTPSQPANERCRWRGKMRNLNKLVC